MKTLVLGAVLLAAFAASTTALVQRPAVPANAIVAYVSAQRLSNETTVGKDGITRIQALQQQKAADVRARQTTLDATRQQLARTTDPAARTTLQAQEQQERAALDRATAEAQTEIQNFQRQMSAELQARLKADIPEVVKGTGIQMVVQQETAVVWAAPGLDLTSAVIERMNRAPAAPPTGPAGPAAR